MGLVWKVGLGTDSIFAALWSQLWLRQISTEPTPHLPLQDPFPLPSTLPFAPPHPHPTPALKLSQDLANLPGSVWSEIGRSQAMHSLHPLPLPPPFALPPSFHPALPALHHTPATGIAVV